MLWRFGDLAVWRWYKDRKRTSRTFAFFPWIGSNRCAWAHLRWRLSSTSCSAGRGWEWPIFTQAVSEGLDDDFVMVRCIARENWLSLIAYWDLLFWLLPFVWTPTWLRVFCSGHNSKRRTGPADFTISGTCFWMLVCVHHLCIWDDIRAFNILC